MYRIDTTVSHPEPAITLAVQAAFGLCSSASLLSLTVASCPPIIESPVTTANTPPGHATCGSRAWDVMNKRMVYLKDLWRVDKDDFEVEGTIYTFLMKHGVENITNCLSSGDITDVDYYANKTHLYMECAWACHTTSIIPHQHY